MPKERRRERGEGGGEASRVADGLCTEKKRWGRASERERERETERERDGEGALGMDVEPKRR